MIVILCHLDGIPKQSMIGVAIYPDVAASLNHSCDPNTFVVDSGQVQIDRQIDR